MVQVKGESKGVAGIQGGCMQEDLEGGVWRGEGGEWRGRVAGVQSQFTLSSSRAPAKPFRVLVGEGDRLAQGQEGDLCTLGGILSKVRVVSWQRVESPYLKQPAFPECLSSCSSSHVDSTFTASTADTMAMARSGRGRGRRR